MDALRTNIDGTNLDHGTFGLIGNAIDLLEGKRVGKKFVLVRREDILVNLCKKNPVAISYHGKSEVSNFDRPIIVHTL